MSSPIRHDNNNDIDPALMYAPPRVREQGQPAPSESSSAPPVDWPWRLHAENGDPDFSGDRKIIEVQRRLTLDPEWVPEPPTSGVDGRDLWKITLRAGGVLGFAALIAWVVVSIPGLRLIGSEAVQASFPGTSISTYLGGPVPPSATATRTRPERPSGQPVLADRAVQEPRKAVVQTPPSRPEPSEPAPPAATPPLQTAALTPPTAPAPAAPSPAAAPAATPPAPVVTTREPTPPPAPPQKTTSDFVIRQIDKDELASMLQRADELMRSGDLSSARLLLRRAAEAGNVYAALTLAGTFDPNVLGKLGFEAGGADIAQARLWYERAEKFGSAEAPRRLQQLSTMGDAAR